MKRIVCLISGHKYYGARQLSGDSMLAGCRRCGKFFAIHKRMRVVTLFDEEMAEFYKSRGKRGLKKYVYNSTPPATAEEAKG